MNPTTRLYYVHDPMCSWCWAFAPVLAELEARLPSHVPMERLLGGLAPDSDEAMPAPMRDYLQATWREIQRRVPGTRFDFAFWARCTPRRSTYPASRAVIAARGQGEAFDGAMTRAIQQAYYTRALNPSEDATLIALAGELGLDVAAFTQALNAPSTGERLLQEIARSRAMGADSFPSLVLQHGGRRQAVPVDYQDCASMLSIIQAACADRSD
ncbi:MAG TPA: DsbA family protein [Thioalkalivibrio sp.]|nr:DsbA family protein [Thioalkalivibrio sp.]